MVLKIIKSQPQSYLGVNFMEIQIINHKLQSNHKLYVSNVASMIIINNQSKDTTPTENR